MPTEAQKQAGRKYYEKNREAMRAKALKFYRDNREKRLEQMKAWRERNPVIRKEHERSWVKSNTSRKYSLNILYRERNRIQTILRSAKSRAKAKGLEFSITSKDIFIPEKCPYLDIPITTSLGRGRGALPGSPALDRIDPTKGYIVGNVEVISHRANTVKSCGTADEHRRIAERMERLCNGR